MLICRKISLLRKSIAAFKSKGQSIGFVPTMGFLHEGHISLGLRARKENDCVVVSAFINPLQFGPREDFHKYPRDLKRDIKMLRGFCDILFVPSADEMYSKTFSTTVEVKVLSERLCGRSRPGHFVGVTTIVAKLFNSVLPDRAYFGQKDAQQAMVIQKMVLDLNFPITIRVLPIVREKDGLAMSSRNVFLSPKERSEAVVLFQALKAAERMLASGVRDTARILESTADFISRTSTARIDYLEIVDKKNLEPLKFIEKEALFMIALHIGQVRLIDNTILKVK